MIKNTWSVLLFAMVIITGCRKNSTRYFADAEAPGLAIFSNTNNNILSCFVDGKPWRTNARITSGFSPQTQYEIYVQKQRSNGLRDTLVLNWTGYFEGNLYSGGSIGLVLSVDKNFSISNLNALQGQRLIIDTAVNGYFVTGIAGLNINGTKGKGSIYFNVARFDSIAPNLYKGSLSGLLEADFGTFNITKGRFDHFLEPNQIFLF